MYAIFIVLKNDLEQFLPPSSQCNAILVSSATRLSNVKILCFSNFSFSIRNKEKKDWKEIKLVMITHYYIY